MPRAIIPEGGLSGRLIMIRKRLSRLRANMRPRLAVRVICLGLMGNSQLQAVASAVTLLMTNTGVRSGHLAKDATTPKPSGPWRLFTNGT